MVQHLERTRPPGRNDPCPCGSGKKYKRCCLLRETAYAPVRQFSDVMEEVFSADEVGDRARVLSILEEARASVRNRDLDSLLIERYLELPPDQAQITLEQWWEEDRDRYSGTGLAQSLIAQGQREEAYRVLKESSGQDAPAEYWRLLSMLHDENGDTPAAVAAMELYTRLIPEEAEGWVALSELQNRSGQRDRALLSLRRAGDVAPERLLPRMLRVRLLADASCWREVRDLAEALLEGCYDDVTEDMQFELRNVLAKAYFILGDFSAARQLLHNLWKQRPDDAGICYRLAHLELQSRRYGKALAAIERYPLSPEEDRVLDLRLRCLLALHEYDEALLVARQLDGIDGEIRAVDLVRGAETVASKEYTWGLEHLDDHPHPRYRDLWNNLRLDCLIHLGRWQEVPAVLKATPQAEETVLIKAALAALAAQRFDLADRIAESIEDQQSTEVRAVAALLGPLKQVRRAAEVRRQHQVDEAEKQRRAMESRELRRRVRDLESHNASLAEALARSEAERERLLERVGIGTDGDNPTDWEAHWQELAERAHKDALAKELQQAEQRLRSMLGDRCWLRLSESARVSLREGEWLFAAVEGENRDYGAALLEYARGLERAFKDSIFVATRQQWEKEPGPVDRLQDEGHDPSLGPFVRYLLQGTHMTLGSMAAALERMGDVRRQGVAIGLLRRQLRVSSYDERALEDWHRTAENLALAADARNRPAHAGSVSRDAVRQFRELVLGSDGLLRALDYH